MPRPTIALVGAGEYLEDTRTVDEHLLGLLDTGGRTPVVACLPTAAASEGEPVWTRWSRQGAAWFAGLGCEAHAVDLVDAATAADPDLVARIEAADLVYLSGGKPLLLHELLVGTPAWKAILGVLDRGGILAGCSAGAMVQGEQIAPIRQGGSPIPGTALLPHAIVIPHFDEFPELFRAAAERLVASTGSTTGSGLSVVGIDGGTALVRHRDELRVVGSGSVTIWGPKGHDVYRDEVVPTDAIGPVGDQRT